jgi:hypothetical protein
MWSIHLLLIETGIRLAPFMGVAGGDGASDVSAGAGYETTSNEMARDVLYMPKNVLSNSGDVEYSPSVVRDRYQATPLIVMEGGDGPSDVSDGAGDRTTSNEMARDLLYMPKNFHSNSGDVEYSASVVRDRYLAAPLIAKEGGDGTSDAGDGAGDRTTSNEMARGVLYMPKTFHSNSGDVEYSPPVVRDRYLAAPLIGVEGGDGISDVSDGAGDGTTSNDVVKDVL